MKLAILATMLGVASAGITEAGCGDDVAPCVDNPLMSCSDVSCSDPLIEMVSVACIASGEEWTCTEDCFPASSKVELENGDFVTMSKLKVGDRVRVNAKEFAPVFMFSHVEKDTRVEYFQLTTKSGATLSISAGHLVSANGTLRASREVEVGQTVTLADGSTDTVVSITKKVMKGLYAPQTTAGTIVVDGVEASCFTDFASPLTQQVMLYPMRMAYELKGAEWWLGGNKDAGVPTWLRNMVVAAKDYLA